MGKEDGRTHSETRKNHEEMIKKKAINKATVRASEVVCTLAFSAVDKANETGDIETAETILDFAHEASNSIMDEVLTQHPDFQKKSKKRFKSLQKELRKRKKEVKRKRKSKIYTNLHFQKIIKK